MQLARGRERRQGRPGGGLQRSGAHTLAQPGDRVYPDIGNGGYASVHSDVHIGYDAIANQFLPGTHVDLQQRSTQCLSDFSLDFDRHNSVTSTTVPGPDFTVQSVTVDGRPATFKFVQPTYPGDPNGQDDPDPLAHRTGLTTPINADNPNPPACPPTSSAAAGRTPPMRRHKLVITPAAPIPSATDFSVTVNYTGRAGVRPSPTGTEGWFRNATAGSEGAMVTSEPTGTSLDPAQQPPVGQAHLRHLRHRHQGQAARARPRSPRGSRRQRGGRELPRRLDELPLEVLRADRELPGREQCRQLRADRALRAVSGVIYYEAQSSAIPAAQKATNAAVMHQQEDITLFQTQFNGPFPFSTNGVIVGIPTAGFEEEMQTKITLTTWDAPVANDPVTISFKQHIGASDPLRTGTYSKTLTFTLSTTNP